MDKRYGLNRHSFPRCTELEWIRIRIACLHRKLNLLPRLNAMVADWGKNRGGLGTAPDTMRMRFPPPLRVI
ncbi:MAG: hypothetical protein PHF70_10360 [Opitutales bacterium]|nr:hypothetical protein [Opitutales bacterium]